MLSCDWHFASKCQPKAGTHWSGPSTSDPACCSGGAWQFKCGRKHGQDETILCRMRHIWAQLCVNIHWDCHGTRNPARRRKRRAWWSAAEPKSWVLHICILFYFIFFFFLGTPLRLKFICAAAHLRHLEMSGQKDWLWSLTGNPQRQPIICKFNLQHTPTCDPKTAKCYK